MDRRLKLKDDELQMYVHEIGLNEFLKQLERVFERAAFDTHDYDFREITRQYTFAASRIDDLRDILFPANGGTHGK